MPNVKTEAETSMVIFRVVLVSRQYILALSWPDLLLSERPSLQNEYEVCRHYTSEM